MDDILELPNADVSKLQERGQSEGPEDGDSSADEEEGGLDWTKLPCVFQPYSHRMPFNYGARLVGLGPPPLVRSFQGVEKKSMSLRRGRAFKNITSKALELRCSAPWRQKEPFLSAGHFIA
jgi:hypothetical protein